MRNRFRPLFLCCFALLLLIPSHVSGREAGLEPALKDAEKAGVPATTLNRLLALGYKKKVDPSGMVLLIGTLASAKRDGIPLEPLVSKVEEGFLKGAPPTAIKQVLNKKLDDYRYTRRLIEDHQRRQGTRAPFPEEEWIRMTESLYTGLSRTDLDRIMKEASGTSFQVLNRGMEVLSSLKQARFDPALSEQIVSSGLKQNYFTPDHWDFGRVVAAARAKGFSDKDIAAAAIASIQSKGPPGDFGARLGVTAEDIDHHGPHISGISTRSSSGAEGHGGRGTFGGHGAVGGRGSAHSGGHEGNEEGTSFGSHGSLGDKGSDGMEGHGGIGGMGSGSMGGTGGHGSGGGHGGDSGSGGGSGGGHGGDGGSGGGHGGGDGGGSGGGGGCR